MHPSEDGMRGHALRWRLSQFAEWFIGIPKSLPGDSHPVHHGKVKATHLAIRFLPVVEVQAPLQLSTGAANHHDRELAGVMVSGDHAGAEHDH